MSETNRMRAMMIRRERQSNVVDRQRRSLFDDIVVDGGSKRTSARVATIAGAILQRTDDELRRLFRDDPENMMEYIRTLAASALAQDETRGQG